jgi:GNAT superfamily N-acetyltransferase
MRLVPTETAGRTTFNAIFHALDGSSRDLTGPADPRLLVIPIHDETGAVTGGLWGITLFRWLQLEMLVVPEASRGQGLGSALMTSAEAEARNRGCLGIQVDTFSSQAARFYEKLGFAVFGTVEDCPPGHQRRFLQKRLA